MRHEDKMQLLWALSFIISGIIFGMAFIYTPYLGALVVLGYIVLYIGLSSAFLMVFKTMNHINVGVMESLQAQRKEIEDMKDEVKKKYLKKRINEETFQKLEQDYERQLSEVNVRIRNLRRI